MSKYIKLFDKESDYKAFISSETEKPLCLSLSLDNLSVHSTPPPRTMI